MTKAELAQAVEVARKGDGLDVDDSCLYGLYLPDFQSPVHTTIPVVARALRWQTFQLNGKIDTDALAEFGAFARTRIRIIG